MFYVIKNINLLLINFEKYKQILNFIPILCLNNIITIN